MLSECALIIDEGIFKNDKTISFVFYVSIRYLPLQQKNKYKKTKKNRSTLFGLSYT